MDEPKINWYRTKIESAVMRALTMRSDWRALPYALGLLALIALSGSAAYLAWLHLGWGWFLVALFIHGNISGFAHASATHELNHGTAFKTRWLNNLFLYLFSFYSWNNPVLVWTSHKKHHLYTLHHPWDQEVRLPGPPLRGMLFAQLATIFWMWMVQLMLKGLVFHFFGKLSSDWERVIFPESDKANRRALFWWARIILLGHAAMAALFIYLGQWVLLPIVVFPLYAHLLPWIIILPQHHGLQSRVPDFRRCCRTMYMGPVFRFLYWEMNYHTEHHMCPGVPFYNLHKLHRLVQADGGAPACKSLREAWKEMLMTFRKQQEQPGIAYDPFSRGGLPRFVPQEGDGPRPLAGGHNL